MRILRLDLEQGHTGLDLHPFLTVVRNLDDVQRAELIGAIRSLAGGSAAGIRGLIQHHDKLIELDGSTVATLSPGTGADVIVDADASLQSASASASAPASASASASGSGSAARKLGAALAGASGLASGQEPRRQLDSEVIRARIGQVTAQVALDACGSLAVAVVGSLASLDDHEIGELADHVGRLASSLQVVIVSDHPAAAAWAEAAGMSRALVSGPRSAVLSAGAACGAPSRPGPSAS